MTEEVEKIETPIPLRDTIENAVNEIAPEGEKIADKIDLKSEIKESNRDDKGKFKPKQETRQVEPSKTVTATPELIKPRPARPSSWKKEYWDHWDKVDPQLAEYLAQREKEYQSGVSSYRREWESAKPLIDAIAPFQERLQKNNLNPGEWIRNLGNAHAMLVDGSPQEKLSMFAKLIQDYQVPIQALFQQGQDGKIYYNPQVQAYQTQPPQQNVQQLVKNQLEEMLAVKQVKEFNNDNHPHLEELREPMARLLQSGFCNDLQSAYDTAMRMPAHQHIWESLQRTQREADETKKREESVKLAAQARAKVVSPKSGTPAGNGKSNDRKGLRSTYEEAFDSADGQI